MLVILLTGILWALILSLTLVFVLIFLREVFTNTNVLADLIGIGIILALLWWMWSLIPLWMRKTMHRLLRGKDKERRR